jgi:hypothetical protein
MVCDADISPKAVRPEVSLQSTSARLVIRAPPDTVVPHCHFMMIPQVQDNVIDRVLTMPQFSDDFSMGIQNSGSLKS